MSRKKLRKFNKGNEMDNITPEKRAKGNNLNMRPEKIHSINRRDVYGDGVDTVDN
jgi:hypothetical protein